MGSESILHFHFDAITRKGAVPTGTIAKRHLKIVDMHQRTGHLPEAFHIGPKLLWIRRHEPDVFARTRLVLQPRDVVLHRLTGVAATDETHANATLLFNLRQRAWDQGLADAFGIDPALFPVVLPPWAQVAELPGPAAADLGLPAGLPLVTPTN